MRTWGGLRDGSATKRIGEEGLLLNCGSGKTKGMRAFRKEAWKIPDLTSCHAGGGILSE